MTANIFRSVFGKISVIVQDDHFLFAYTLLFVASLKGMPEEGLYFAWEGCQGRILYLWRPVPWYKMCILRKLSEEVQSVGNLESIL